MVDYKSQQEKLESMLDGHVYFPNMLEFYDNVTYNLRFYMLSREAQEELNNLRSTYDFQDYIIPDSEKIIIAETGVSSKYSIDSLSIKTIHASLYQCNIPTTVSLNMTLKEADGCGLLNKIATISKFAGYDGYVLQPYHIDIWFSGYDNRTGIPKKYNCIGNKSLTYEVILSEVKTDIENSGATYTFTMTSASTATVDKETRILFDVGLLQTLNSGNTLRDISNDLERKINSKYTTSHPELAKLYPEDAPILKIRHMIDGDSMLIGTDIEAEKENVVVNAQNPDSSKSISDILMGITANDSKEVNKTLINTKSEVMSTPITSKKETAPIKHQSIIYENVSLDKSVPPKNQDASSGIYTQATTMMSLDEFFQDLCAYSSTLNNKVAKIKYIPESIGTYYGKEHYRVYADIVFTSVPILDYYLEKSKMIQSSNSTVTEEDTTELLFSKQIEEMENIIKSGTLNKLYEWKWNGRNTSVIDVKCNFDSLWYANLGIVNIDNVMKSTSDNVNISNNKEVLIKLGNISRDGNSIMKEFKEALQKINKPLNGIRGLASDKRLYIDDIYNVLSDETKATILSNRKIYEQNTTLTANNTESITTVNEVDVVAAKVGYNNIFGSGGLCEVTLTILGDPYWLGLFSDENLFKSQTNSSFVKMQKFALNMRENCSQDIYGRGYNSFEDCINFSNIFNVTETTHHFDNGKFTQEIKGLIDPNFIHIARMRFKNPKI